ncbi:MAG: PEP-CTERM sorting domain-containing protein [Planctomycetota bacterium]
MKTNPADSPSNASISKRKVAYSLAAGAATLAATADQADADPTIVYSGLKNITNLPSVDPPFPDPYRLFLDLDGDTFSDVALQNAFFGGTPYQGASVLGSGQLVGFNAGPNNYAYVSALTDGDEISPGTVGPTFFGSMAFAGNNPNAQFNDAPDAFVGLSFNIGSDVHYGWVRVGVDNSIASFVVKDWAYESTPGVGIAAGQAPEPTALGLLAAGAAGLATLRSRKKAS